MASKVGSVGRRLVDEDKNSGFFHEAPSWLQAPIQAFLRPALWFPGLRAIHQKKESWILRGEPDFYFFKLKEGLATLQMELYELHDFRSMKISKVDDDKMFIQAYFLTPFMQFLDVVELHVKMGDSGGTEVKAHSFSTGVFPICFPLVSIIINMVLFFIPFYDWGQNKKRLQTIRKISGMHGDVEDQSNC